MFDIQIRSHLINLLLSLLLILSLGCADKPTEPELTEEDVARIVAEELAKMEEAKEDVLSPQEIAEIALKSTVYLRVKTQKKTYYGSGFVVGEGLIATCEHVIEGMVSGTVESVLNETKYPITAVLAVSEKHDLAIIEVQGFTAPPLPLGDSDTVQIGDTVYVVGNPKKHAGTFSIGNISAIRPEGVYLELDKKHVEGKIFQITAPISQGSSGGPVLGNRGEVIGIAIAGFLGAQNLNYVIAETYLKDLLATLR